MAHFINRPKRLQHQKKNTHTDRDKIRDFYRGEKKAQFGNIFFF